MEGQTFVADGVNQAEKLFHRAILFSDEGSPTAILGRLNHCMISINYINLSSEYIFKLSDERTNRGRGSNMDDRPLTMVSNDDLLRILKLIEESDWDEIELTTKNFKLTAAKTLPRDHKASSACPSKPSFSTEEKANPVNDATSDNVEVGLPYRPESKINGPRKNTVLKEMVIYARMMGMFYRSPSPGAPAFVNVGDFVTEHSIVGIIELMKVMNSIESGVEGRISSILVENGQLVQHNEPLFLVDGGDLSTEAVHE